MLSVIITASAFTFAFSVATVMAILCVYEAWVHVILDMRGDCSQSFHRC